MNCFFTRTYRALISATLRGASHAQTPPTIPTATTAASYCEGCAPADIARCNYSVDQLDKICEPAAARFGRGSIFIKSMSRLKLVYVSNPLAVASFTSSPNADRGYRKSTRCEQSCLVG